MEEGQERDTSPDEQGHIIDDDDNEDSPRDVPGRSLDTREKRERHQVCESIDGCYSEQETQVETVSEQSIVQKRKNLSKNW